MPQAPVRQEVFRLDDGEVVIFLPTNLSRSCIEDLKVRLDLFIDRLRWPTPAERDCYLRGLRELARFEESS